MPGMMVQVKEDFAKTGKYHGVEICLRV